MRVGPQPLLRDTPRKGADPGDRGLQIGTLACVLRYEGKPTVDMRTWVYQVQDAAIDLRICRVQDSGTQFVAG